MERKDNDTCKTCKNFKQHYIRWGKGFSKLSYGHCICPRIKKRLSNAPICEQYKKRPKPEPEEEY